MAGPRAQDLTVAVATCGRPAKLERCLDALAGGRAQPHEVIVVDQAATADARAVAARFADLPVRYLDQPRRGLSASRNLALSATSTPLLAVTDDDCAPHEGWVVALAAALAREPAPAAVTGPIVTLGPPPPGAHAVSLRSSAVARDIRGVTLPWTVGSGANFAAPSGLLRQCGGWDERLGVGSPGRAAEDAELLYRILRGGGIVRYEPAAVVAHDWQTWAQRLRSRWSYGFGVGAMCGLCLRRRDPFALRMLAAYARMHAISLAAGVRRRDRAAVREHGRALAGLAQGLAHGLGPGENGG